MSGTDTGDLGPDLLNPDLAEVGTVSAIEVDLILDLEERPCGRDESQISRELELQLPPRGP